MSFDRKDFEAFCVDYPMWIKDHRRLAPPVPPGFFHILNQGGADREWDGQLHSMYSAFALAMCGYEPDEILPLWVVYIKPIYQHGKKIPVKAIYAKLGIGRTQFYERAHKMAEKVWNHSLRLQRKNAVMMQEEELCVD